MRRAHLIYFIAITSSCLSLGGYSASPSDSSGSINVTKEETSRGGTVIEIEKTGPGGNTKTTVIGESQSGSQAVGESIQGTNGGRIAVGVGKTTSGVMETGIAVTTPDRPITITAPVTMVVTRPNGESKTIPKGASVTLPPGTTIAREETRGGSITITTTQPLVVPTDPPIKIPAGSSWTLPSGSRFVEISSPNGMTNFNAATGWSTSSVIVGPEGHFYADSNPLSIGAQGGAVNVINTAPVNVTTTPTPTPTPSPAG